MEEGQKEKLHLTLFIYHIAIAAEHWLELQTVTPILYRHKVTRLINDAYKKVDAALLALTNKMNVEEADKMNQRQKRIVEFSEYVNLATEEAIEEAKQLLLNSIVDDKDRK